MTQCLASAGKNKVLSLVMALWPAQVRLHQGGVDKIQGEFIHLKQILAMTIAR